MEPTFKESFKQYLNYYLSFIDRTDEVLRLKKAFHLYLLENKKMSDLEKNQTGYARRKMQYIARRRMTEKLPEVIEPPGLSSPESSVNLLDLPEEILLRILSYMSYHNSSELRRTCQSFNRLGQQVLNQGFLRVDKFHSLIKRRVKSKLPRRESERRNHSLARHEDVLLEIQLLLPLLKMTYRKYIDMGFCSFIPGKVLDELFHILRVLQVEDCTQIPRAHEFLQELRDISSMAVEHFQEKIVPLLKQKIPHHNMCGLHVFGDPSAAGRSYPDFSLTASSVSSSPRADVIKLQNQLQNCRKEMGDMRIKIADNKKRLMEHEKKNIEQCQIITEQNTTLLEQKKKISDLSKKNLEYDQKFSYIFAELSRCLKSGSNTSNADGYRQPTSSTSHLPVTTDHHHRNEPVGKKPSNRKQACAVPRASASRKRRSKTSNPVSTETKNCSGKRRKNKK